MGKASRRKKEKRAQVVEESPQAGKVPSSKKKGLSLKKAKSKKVKKIKKSLKAVLKKQQGKRTQKVTVKDLNEKAAAVESALSSAVKKAKEVVAKKEKGTSGNSDSFKSFIAKNIEGIKEGMDPEKLDAFKKEIKIIVKKGATYLVGITAVVAILVVVELHSNGRTFPGTIAAGVDIGYLPFEKAQEKLTKEVDAYINQPVIFSFEGDSFEVSKEDLGIQLSTSKTLEGLPLFAFQKENPLHLTATIFINNDIAVSHTFDENRIMKRLEEKLFLKEKRARNARFVFQDGDLQIETEKSGVAINKEKLIANLSTNINTLDTQTIELEIQDENPIITAVELEKERDRLIGLLNKPITLSAEGQSMSLKLIDHLNVVHFKPIKLENQPLAMAHANPTEKGTVRIAIDKNGIKEFLYENLIKEIERPTSPAKIFKNEEGKIIIEGKGQDGRSISHEQLVEALNEAANSDAETIEVYVEKDKAPLEISDDLKALGIKELLATGHSAYYGSSPGRMFNIEHGAAIYNGFLLAPGEEFSFNEILGPVDGSNGFRLAKVIKKNKLEMEYGGGICQVSTTLYRAVLQAGLPITERKPHSWKVSYYGQSMGHGLDATIYPGVVDLKFRNDTPGHLVIQSYVEDAEAYFKIYGTDDGRTTILDGPYGGGLSYRWNRTVLDKDGKPMFTDSEESGVEEIWSQYKPIPRDPPPKPKPVATPAPAAGVSEGF